MNEKKELEEKLRESACTGDIDTLKMLVEGKYIDVNSQNNMNGWTALHWACKRNHVTVVTYLLSRGADKSILTNDGQAAAQMTSSPEIKAQLGYQGGEDRQSALPITPNYLANQVFPYAQDPQQHPVEGFSYKSHAGVQKSANHIQKNPDVSELVLKARVAYTDEKDFIEVELDRNNLTFESLISLLTRELSVERRLIYKIRKLPNTIIRKDKDVRRLTDFQELEVVLTNRAMSASSRSYGDISDGIKHEQILY